MEIQECNARIERTTIGYEDHDCFEYVNVAFYFGGGSQGTSMFIPTDEIGWFIKRFIDTVGVRSWEDLPNVVCRIRRDLARSFEPIVGVGNYLCDEWFMWADELSPQETSMKTDIERKGA